MGVRVRLKIKSARGVVKTSALVSTGFEAERSEILLPAILAERLGLYPPGSGSTLEEYSVVGGTTLIIRSSQPVYVQVLVGDRDTNPVTAVPVISSGEDEVLISDKLASKLKLSIEDPGEGLWRFRDEPPAKRRTSTPPEYWTHR